MAKIYQANSTLLVSVEQSDNLGHFNMRQFAQIITKQLSFPFPNIIVDLKALDDIDPFGIAMLKKANRLAKSNRWQLSLFNANDKVLCKLLAPQAKHNLFICDKLALVS